MPGAAVSIRPWCAIVLAMLLTACGHRTPPPDVVSGDAFFDLSDLSKYRDRVAPTTVDGKPRAGESAILRLLTRYAGAAGRIDLPESLRLTCVVKDTTGHVLAAHAVERGHNRWSDVIHAAPVDLYLKIETPWLGHDVFIERVDDPHAGPIDINIAYELMHRVL